MKQSRKIHPFTESVTPVQTVLKYKDITEKIIGASFEVHTFFGNRFQEVIYQRALAWELKQDGLVFAKEIVKDIFYKDLPKPIGR